MELAQVYQSDALTLWEGIVADIKTEYLSEVQRYPWIIGFSGGKDSTLVAQAVLEAVLAVPPSARSRDVHVVSNDTLASQSPDDYDGKSDDYLENIGLPICFNTNAVATKVLQNMFRGKANFSTLPSGVFMTLKDLKQVKVKAF